MTEPPRSRPITEAPHAPAAFINALAEEGTKDEAIFWLQKQWNECCALRSQVASARKALEEMLIDPPPTLDEPDTDAEVIIKMRVIARAALKDIPK